MADQTPQRTAPELTHRVARLEMLLKISRMMNATTNQGTLIKHIAEEVGAYVRADRCSIFFHNREADELYTYLAMGLAEGQQIRMPSGAGIAGYVFQSGEVLNVPDVDQEPRFDKEAAKRTGYETRSMLTYPIRNRRGKAIGVFQLLNKLEQPGHFTEEDEAFLGELVEQVADLLDLMLRKDELARRNAELEAQMAQLSSFDYLIGDRTLINNIFRYNRRVHYWIGMVVMTFLALMAVTSLVMVRSHDFRKLTVGLHIGTGFGLGGNYYLYTDLIAVLTLILCCSGVLMYVYPPLNRWLKAKKNELVKRKARSARGA